MLALFVVVNPSLSHKSPPFYVLDPDNYRSYFPDHATFTKALSVAPFFDLPPSPTYVNCLTAFYYRIRSFRKHIVRYNDYWVVTEFLPPVPWAGTYRNFELVVTCFIVTNQSE